MSYFFDPTTVERDPQVTIVPDGQYICRVFNAKERISNRGRGAAIWLKIVYPVKYKDMLIGEYFNIEHENKDAAKIGQMNFAKFLDCIDLGHKPIKDPSELEKRMVKCDVEKKIDNTGKEQSRVKRYHVVTKTDIVEMADTPTYRDADVPF